jgi:hypothetical protein
MTNDNLSKKIVENGMYDHEVINDRKKSGKGMWEDALFSKDVREAVKKLKENLSKGMKVNIHNAMYLAYFNDELNKIFGEALTGEELI